MPFAGKTGRTFHCGRIVPISRATVYFLPMVSRTLRCVFLPRMLLVCVREIIPV